MLRPVLVVTGTVAGLIALFSFKTHVPGVASVAEPSSPAALTNSAAPTTGSSAAPSTAASSSGPKKPAATPSATHSTAPATSADTPDTTPTTKAPATTPTSAKPSSTPTKKATPKPTPTPTKSTAPAGPQQFAGPTVDTQYGPVQVVITVSGGKITSADDAQQPADSIGANAIPQLNSEVLTAQSANIQAVSGATFTSQGYISSLQQAVNQAGL